MSFAGDAEFHNRRIRAHSAIFLRDLATWKVEREGMRTGKHFVELYNEHGQPSPTGLLLAKEYWGVIYGEPEYSTSIVTPTLLLRAWALPRFVKRPEWGGDHGAFCGVLVPLTRLASWACTRLTPEERHEVDRLVVQLRAASAPPRPAEQDCLWPDVERPDEDEHD